MAIQFKVRVDRVVATRTLRGESVEAFMVATNPTGQSLGFQVTLTDPDEIALVQPGAWFKLGLVPDTEPPSAPTGLVATLRPDQTIELQWSPSTDDLIVRSYRVYEDDEPIAEVEGLSWISPPMVPGEYNFSVAALDFGGNISQRTPAPTIVGATPEPPPTRSA